MADQEDKNKRADLEEFYKRKEYLKDENRSEQIAKRHERFEDSPGEYCGSLRSG